VSVLQCCSATRFNLVKGKRSESKQASRSIEWISNARNASQPCSSRRHIQCHLSRHLSRYLSISRTVFSLKRYGRPIHIQYAEASIRFCSCNCLSGCLRRPKKLALALDSDDMNILLSAGCQRPVEPLQRVDSFVADWPERYSQRPVPYLKALGRTDVRPICKWKTLSFLAIARCSCERSS
jgi:hypothetical protein